MLIVPQRATERTDELHPGLTGGGAIPRGPHDDSHIIFLNETISSKTIHCVMFGFHSQPHETVALTFGDVSSFVDADLARPTGSTGGGLLVPSSHLL